MTVQPPVPELSAAEKAAWRVTDAVEALLYTGASSPSLNFIRAQLAQALADLAKVHR